MKVAISVVLGLAVLLGLFMAASSPTSDDKSSSAGTDNKPQSFDAIKADMADGAKLVDVRTNQEYIDGHIEGSELLPLAEIQSGVYPQVSKDTKLYVYCRSGSRSAQATKLLKTAGYTDVIDLGAYTDVVNLGGKLVK